jgi:hypothetical protein
MTNGDRYLIGGFAAIRHSCFVINDGVLGEEGTAALDYSGEGGTAALEITCD